MAKIAVIALTVTILLVIFIFAGSSIRDRLTSETFSMDRVTENMLQVSSATKYREMHLNRIAQVAEEDYEAAYELGRRYVNGRGLVADIPMGVRLLTRAADGGYVPAMEFLAELYASGVVFGTQDKKKAFLYYEMAAEKGSIIGSHYLCYTNAYNKNYESAYRWCADSADKGVPMSMGILGEMYARGAGIEKDLDKAKLYICTAREKGRMVNEAMARYGITSCAE